MIWHDLGLFLMNSRGILGEWLLFLGKMVLRII